jgi:hypothetical protein
LFHPAVTVAPAVSVPAALVNLHRGLLPDLTLLGLRAILRLCLSLRGRAALMLPSAAAVPASLIAAASAAIFMLAAAAPAAVPSAVAATAAFTFALAESAGRRRQRQNET